MSYTSDRVLPMTHTIQRFNSKLSAAEAVTSVVEIAESQGGSAIFTGKGETTRRRMKRTACAMPEGWNADIFGHSDKPDYHRSEVFDSFITTLSVYRDGIDPHTAASWGNIA